MPGSAVKAIMGNMAEIKIPRWLQSAGDAVGRWTRAVWMFVRYDNLKGWLPTVWGRSFLLKVITASFILGIMGAFGLYWLSRDLPTPKELSRIEQRHVTRLFDGNGRLVKEFFTQQREAVQLDRVPRHLREALLATEDRDFYDHWGINLQRIAGAMVSNVINLEIISGASTITQQLARNLFENIGREQTITRKLKEQLTAVALERNYSKDEILQMFLNQMYFANGAYGIQQAAQNYYGKDVEDLDLLESAHLVGVLQGPYFYYKRPQLAQERRNRVLQYMVDAGYLEQAAVDSLTTHPLAFAEADSTEVTDAPYFVEHVRRYLQNAYGEDLLYKEGAYIRTTLDTEIQTLAERYLFQQLDEKQAQYEEWVIQPRLQEILANTPEGAEPDTAIIDTLRARYRLQGALVAMDPRTGDILALVGGRDFEESKWNRATQALRQAGSAFKPFLYTAALDNGYTPASRIMNQPLTISQPDGSRWTPTNYYETFGDALTLREALKQSINLVAARVVMGASRGTGPGSGSTGGSMNPQVLLNYARQFGITTPLRAYPSLAIGAGSVYLLEMVSAYSAFANLGDRAEPRFIKEVHDRLGRLVENQPVRRKPTLDPALSYLMVDLMKGTLAQGGTGQLARTYYGIPADLPAAGKTGTTNDYTDAWFIGYTPYLVAGVWIGFDEHLSMELPQGRAVTGIAPPSGAVMAMPVWARFMAAVYRELDLPKEDWSMPAGVVERELCRTSTTAPGTWEYRLALPTCPDRFTEIFLETNQPTEKCEVHDISKRRDWRLPPPTPR